MIANDSADIILSPPQEEDHSASQEILSVQPTEKNKSIKHIPELLREHFQIQIFLFLAEMFLFSFFLFYFFSLCFFGQKVNNYTIENH